MATNLNLFTTEESAKEEAEGSDFEDIEGEEEAEPVFTRETRHLIVKARYDKIPFMH